MLHGGFNPVSIVDGWGFPQEAARREWIVIARALELDDLLDEVLAEAMALYSRSTLNESISPDFLTAAL